MPQDALISVIVPVYKTEAYLEACVDSILAQTYKNLEVILIDDGSPDRCGEICDAYANADARVRVIHKENGGLSSARNAGLAIATGEYIGFVDSDDSVLPEMFGVLLALLYANHAQIAVCGFYQVFKSGTLEIHNGSGVCVRNRLQALEGLINNQNIQSYSWNKLFYAGLFAGVRFPDGRILEDAAVVYRLFEQCAAVVFTDECLYKYNCLRGDSIMSTLSEKCFADWYLADCERLEYLWDKYPSLRDTLRARHARACLETVVSVDRSGQYAPLYEAAARWLRENRRGIKVDTVFTRSEMLKLRLFCFSPALLRFLIQSKRRRDG